MGQRFRLRNPVEYDLVDSLENDFTSTFLHAVLINHIAVYEGNFTTPADVADGMVIMTTHKAVAPKQDVVIGVFATDGSDYGVLKFEADGDVKVFGSLTAEKEYSISGFSVIDPWGGR